MTRRLIATKIARYNQQSPGDVMVVFSVEKIQHSESHLAADDCIALHFSKNGSEVCSVMLAPKKEGGYETHISDLPEAYLNKGFGVEIYKQVFSYCLEEGIHLSSSKSRCDDAERLWKSIRLNKMFKIEEKGERFYLLKSKGKKVTIA